MALRGRADWLEHAVIGAVYVGAVVFGALWVYPVLAREAAVVRELNDAQENLGEWLGRAVLPTEERIRAEKARTSILEAELERLADWYVRRSARLHRRPLESYQRNPARLKANYEALKARLEARARYETVRAELGEPFLPLRSWEAAGKLPRVAEFAELERTACAAQMLVMLLTATERCAIGRIDVGRPARGPGPFEVVPGEAALACFRVPVSAEFFARFEQLPRILDHLATAGADYPCMIVRSLRVAPAGGMRVRVQLDLDMLDFQRLADE